MSTRLRYLLGHIVYGRSSVVTGKELEEDGDAAASLWGLDSLRLEAERWLSPIEVLSSSATGLFVGDLGRFLRALSSYLQCGLGLASGNSSTDKWPVDTTIGGFGTPPFL
jgi:hypothetical protein